MVSETGAHSQFSWNTEWLAYVQKFHMKQNINHPSHQEVSKWISRCDRAHFFKLSSWILDQKRRIPTRLIPYFQVCSDMKWPFWSLHHLLYPFIEKISISYFCFCESVRERRNFAFRSVLMQKIFRPNSTNISWKRIFSGAGNPGEGAGNQGAHSTAGHPQTGKLFCLYVDAYKKKLLL